MFWSNMLKKILWCILYVITCLTCVVFWQLTTQQINNIDCSKIINIPNTGSNYNNNFNIAKIKYSFTDQDFNNWWLSPFNSAKDVCELQKKQCVSIPACACNTIGSVDWKFWTNTAQRLKDCLPPKTPTQTPPAVAVCEELTSPVVSSITTSNITSSSIDSITVDQESDATANGNREKVKKKIKSWFKNDSTITWTKIRQGVSKWDKCKLCGDENKVTRKTLEILADDSCFQEQVCVETAWKKTCTPEKIETAWWSASSFWACKPSKPWDPDCECGIKLNTNVPFIGNCISYSSDGSAWWDGLVVTIANAFPALMGGLSKIVVTLILITSFVTLVIAGVSISTGDAIGVGKGMDLIWKVVTGIALLWASGVILHLINPNFFT